MTMPHAVTVLSLDNFTFPLKSNQENVKGKGINVCATGRVLKLP
jgi:hypothetical protein